MHPEPHDHTLMRCCGKLVQAEFQQCSDRVIVYWHCVVCDTSFQRSIGTIDARKAYSTKTGKPIKPDCDCWPGIIGDRSNHQEACALIRDDVPF